MGGTIRFWTGVDTRRDACRRGELIVGASDEVVAGGDGPSGEMQRPAG